MLLLGLENLESLSTGASGSAKMVFNGRGALFLPVSRQHRDVKAEGISYEDNYRGDALAAMLARGRIEIRYHSAFTDSEVAAILHRLTALPELSALRDWAATYQGRPLAGPMRD